MVATIEKERRGRIALLLLGSAARGAQFRAQQVRIGTKRGPYAPCAAEQIVRRGSPEGESAPPIS